MKYAIKYKNTSISLDSKTFLAKGGEGEVHAKGKVAYKICEPGKMIPEQKIKELSVLSYPNIIKPEDIIVNSKTGDDVGYTMKYAEKTSVFCQLFTKSFRARSGISPDDVIKLVRRMQETISHIHSHDILIVDLNELNFLLSEDFKEVFFIDTNSYQTPSYPATAIMDSIRDRHAKKYDRGTDWFSFGLLAFQAFIGIHPYKGNHPNFKDSKTALDLRMKANITILNPEVIYPKGACQPLSSIPSAYMDWFKVVLEGGKRIPPPSDLVAKIVISTKKATIPGTLFDVEEIFEYDSDIISHYAFGGLDIVLCGNHAFVDRRKYDLNGSVIGMNGMSPTSCLVEPNKVSLTNLADKSRIELAISADSAFVSGGRIYLMSSGNVMEVQFKEVGKKLFAHPKIVATYLPNITKQFGGVLFQSMFDATAVSIFPSEGHHQRLFVKEIYGHQVIDAIYDNRVLGILTADRSGKYHRHILMFREDWGGYTITTTSDLSVPSLNATFLPNGICVLINEDDEVVIFSQNNIGEKTMKDPAITADCRLSHRGSYVLFHRGNKLSSIKVKKP